MGGSDKWNTSSWPRTTVQPPIQFGGQQLPAMEVPLVLPPVKWHGAVGDAPGLSPNEEKHRRIPLHKRTFDTRPVPPAPAGEETVAARIVALSRASLAARIRHGVPMKELHEHFVRLLRAENELLTEQLIANADGCPND